MGKLQFKIFFLFEKSIFGLKKRETKLEGTGTRANQNRTEPEPTETEPNRTVGFLFCETTETEPNRGTPSKKHQKKMLKNSEKIVVLL